jgi:hypothetical protein
MQGVGGDGENFDKWSMATPAIDDVPLSVQTCSNLFATFTLQLNPELNIRFRFGDCVNLNLNFEFGSIKFGFELKFRTKLCHH